MWKYAVTGFTLKRIHVFNMFFFLEFEGKKKVLSKRFTAQTRDCWRTYGKF